MFATHGIIQSINRAAAASFLLDDYPGAAVAYSMRKLRSAYTGNAIRVRRSNDNAEQDIGFVAGQLDESALTSFVGSNDGFVVTWYDQSVDARHASQSTASKQPQIVTSGTVEKLNGKPTIKFISANQTIFPLTSQITYTDDSSVFYVANRNTTSDVIAPLGDESGTYQYLMFSDNNAYFLNNAGVVNVRNYSPVGTGNFLNTGIYILNDFYAWSNGVSKSLSLLATIGPQPKGNTFIGARPGVWFSNGPISEIIFYTSNQTSNRVAIEINMNSNYMIF